MTDKNDECRAGASKVVIPNQTKYKVNTNKR